MRHVLMTTVLTLTALGLVACGGNEPSADDYLKDMYGIEEGTPEEKAEQLDEMAKDPAAMMKAMYHIELTEELMEKFLDVYEEVKDLPKNNVAAQMAAIRKMGDGWNLIKFGKIVMKLETARAGSPKRLAANKKQLVEMDKRIADMEEKLESASGDEKKRLESMLKGHKMSRLTVVSMIEAADPEPGTIAARNKAIVDKYLPRYLEIEKRKR